MPRKMCMGEIPKDGEIKDESAPKRPKFVTPKGFLEHVYDGWTERTLANRRAAGIGPPFYVISNRPAYSVEESVRYMKQLKGRISDFSE